MPPKHPSALENHPDIRSLAAEVRAKLKIKYLLSNTASPWSSAIKGGRLEIEYSASPYPVSCLAHELLHAKLQLQGYRRLKLVFTGHGEDLHRLMKALDNELQHHRMYPYYLALGRPAEEFYTHLENANKEYCQRIAAQGGTLLSLIPDLLTVLAPGGEFTASEREQLIADFLGADGGRHRTQLSSIREAFVTWTNNPSLNAEDTVRTVLRTIYDPCHVWFGYGATNRHPENGFFVGQEFQMVNQGTD